MNSNNRWRCGTSYDRFGYGWQSQSSLDAPTAMSERGEASTQPLSWHEKLLLAAVFGAPSIVGLVIGALIPL